MKVVITGTRDWGEPERVQQAVWDRIRDIHEQHPDLEVLVGDARGVDAWAYAYCFARGIKVTRFEPKWRVGGVYNPRAGHERNQVMIDEKPDLCLAFWDGSSRGTKDCIDRAYCAGVEVELGLGWRP